MLLNKMVLEGTDILLVILQYICFLVILIYFLHGERKEYWSGIGYMVFVIWQFVLQGKRLNFRYDRKIPDYFPVVGAP